MSFGKSGGLTFPKILRNIVLILFFVIFASIVYNFGNKESDTVSALLTDATDSTIFEGVFIRDEQVLNYSGNGVVSYHVTDGGRLGNGSVISQVYQTDEQIKKDREIEKLSGELDILNKIQNPGTLESAQPANLSEEIEETYRSLIYSRDMGDFDEIGNSMVDFLVDLSTYQIVTEEASDFTARINEINSKLTQLKGSTDSPLETITSDRSAYFVSRCDGYEDILKKENIDSLTIQQIRGVKTDGAEIAGVVGKLVDGYEWYLAGIINNSKKEYAPGDTVHLRFEYSDEMFLANVVDIRDEGNPAESIIIVSCSKFNKELIQNRTANVELVKGTYTGLKVPRESIRFLSMEEKVKDDDTGITSTVAVNYKGVYIREGEQIEFKKIDVIYEGSDYVLSEVHDDDKSYLARYDDIMIEGADSDE